MLFKKLFLKTLSLRSHSGYNKLAYLATETCKYTREFKAYEWRTRSELQCESRARESNSIMQPQCFLFEKEKENKTHSHAALFRFSRTACWNCIPRRKFCHSAIMQTSCFSKTKEKKILLWCSVIIPSSSSQLTTHWWP